MFGQDEWQQAPAPPDVYDGPVNMDPQAGPLPEPDFVPDGRPLLHVVWVGSAKVPPLAQTCIDGWRRLNPTWRLCIWRDDKGWPTEPLIAKMRGREWNGVADIMRYSILWRWGGVVVDADSEAVKPLDEGDFREIVEGRSEHSAFSTYESEIAKPGLIACGLMGGWSGPGGSDFWGACVAEVWKTDMSKWAWESVGPGLVTRVAARVASMDPWGLKVYPARTAIPKHYSGTLAPGACPIFARQLWGSKRGYKSASVVAQ